MRKSTCIFTTLLIVYTIPADATGDGSGLVQNIIANPGGSVTFSLDKPHSGGPACGSGTFKDDFAFDGNTADGKNKLAILIAAANGRKLVRVLGTGNCAVWGDRETANYIIVYF
ncbi:hypothetical protein ACTJJ7_21025 [Phyllobacterium sp. 22229]|uniref:hypothetical protein n=1 Tax=Phyllobacterium sp. 22229 TaxID=3453895 RepID=UPI003F87A3E6